ncbi:MAG: transferase [Thermoplasmata archaeon]|nr:MAG: transferase [Thermoplasmata archaeon]
MEEYRKGKNCKIYEGSFIFPNVSLGNNVTVFPGGVIGRAPVSSGATIRRLDVDKVLPVSIGDNCVIGSNAVIYMDVKIGKNSMICDTACIREGCRIGDSVVIAMGVTINYNTKIGDRVKVMDNTHLTGNMIVEDDVFIGMLVTTANDNGMGRNVPKRAKDWLGKGPTIRRFATIGQGACILPSVDIGEDSIVGANSVVTKNVGPRTVVMGIPAKFVRNLFDHEIR